jgi:hypothetical protein
MKRNIMAGVFITKISHVMVISFHNFCPDVGKNIYCGIRLRGQKNLGRSYSNEENLEFSVGKTLT